jgi:hypothetical protein
VVDALSLEIVVLACESALGALLADYVELLGGEQRTPFLFAALDPFGRVYVL